MPCGGRVYAELGSSARRVRPCRIPAIMPARERLPPLQARPASRRRRRITRPLRARSVAVRWYTCRDAVRAARRESAADRAGRAAARPGAERAHGRDRRRQDGARARARPAARRPRDGVGRSCAPAPPRPTSRASSTLPERCARSCGGAPAATDAEELVLARRVGADGRTRAYLNGRSATVADLRDLGGRARLLLRPARAPQADPGRRPAARSSTALRAGAGARLRACAAGVRARRARWQARARGAARAVRRRASASSTCSSTSSPRSTRAAPDEREHERLLAARERLRRLDALRAAAGAGAEALAPETPPRRPGAAQLLAGAAARLDALAGVDPRLDALAERLRALVIESQDLAARAARLRRAAGRRGEDGLAATRGRRAPGGDRAAGAQARRHDRGRARVRRARARARATSWPACRGGARAGRRAAGARRARRSSEHVQALCAARASWRPRAWRVAVREQLASLAMARRQLRGRRSPSATPGPSGGDAVEFLIAPNPGVPAGPLREIASGGELSRVMLAIMHSAARGAGRCRRAALSTDATLVFDEVDAGIGGHTARAVGERLRDAGARPGRCCASPTCRRSPRSATATSRSSRTPPPTPRARRSCSSASARSSPSWCACSAPRTPTRAARRHARDLRKAA